MLFHESVADGDEARIGLGSAVDAFLQFLQFARSSEMPLQLRIFEYSS